jgi:hypothetical protein
VAGTHDSAGLRVAGFGTLSADAHP